MLSSESRTFSSLPCCCTGGLPQPGPIFQALPEPLPLPPLPQPERPAEAMTPSMAPETAPAGLPQPGSVLQVLLLSVYGLCLIHQIEGTVGCLPHALTADRAQAEHEHTWKSALLKLPQIDMLQRNPSVCLVSRPTPTPSRASPMAASCSRDPPSCRLSCCLLCQRPSSPSPP